MIEIMALGEKEGRGVWKEEIQWLEVSGLGHREMEELLIQTGETSWDAEKGGGVHNACMRHV